MKIYSDKPERRVEIESVVVPFGKRHRGQTVGEIFDEDPAWIDWAQDLDPEEVKPFMREAVKAIREYAKLPVVAKVLGRL